MALHGRAELFLLKEAASPLVQNQGDDHSSPHLILVIWGKALGKSYKKAMRQRSRIWAVPLQIVASEPGLQNLKQNR